jgi:Flp pilus assembly protein TadG
MLFGDWIGRTTRGLAAFARRMAQETRGNVAMLFGLSLPVLILMTVGGVDIHRASTVRVNLQDALDAAALAAARSPYVRNEDIQRVGMAALKANLKAYPSITLLEADTTFVLEDEVVVANSKVNVKTLVANIFLPPYGKFMDDYLPVGAHSEVDRSSRNIEVALVLDVTGSMAEGTRIEDLIAAAKELVDIVVQPVQTPYYSKVALVPYSSAVNVGNLADDARGPAATYVNVTNASWSVADSARSISAVSRANPAVVTSSRHGFAANDVIWISGVRGMTQLNDKAFIVHNPTTDTFQLKTLSGNVVNSRNYSNYDSRGTIRKCQTSDCSVVVTAPGHGLRNNEYVRFSDVSGMTQLNNRTFLVGNSTSNTFTIDLEPDEVNTYTGGGKAWCAQAGCTWFAFENVYGDIRTHRISDECVTERSGAQAYTDAAPSGARVGRHYPGTSGACGIDAEIVPLSSNAAALKSVIDDFEPAGSTAGQIGIGWGWYMVSPNFNSLWPSNGAAPYNTRETLKAVVIMTDGEFNTPYCSGVVPDNWGGGVYSASSRIDCSQGGTAQYANPFVQSKALCDGMKAQGVVVYTVGLQIDNGGQAADLLSYCASTPANFFLPANGGDLSEAFAAIGRDITQLRISK